MYKGSILNKISRDTHIAFFLFWFHGGGIPHVMTNLAKALGARGYSVDFVVGKSEGKYLNNISDDVNVVELNASRSILCIPGLIRYLKEERPNFMITANTHLNLIAVLAHQVSRIAGKVIITEHAQFHQAQENRKVKSPLLAIIIPILMSYFYKQADQIVGVSNSVAFSLIDRFGFDRDQVCTIWNPVLDSDFEIKVKEAIKFEWFDDGEYPVIIAVGRLTRQKNYPLLLDSIAEVQNTINVRLLILGEGEDKEFLEDYASKKGIYDKVRFLGYVRNPLPYMREADLFVLSSLWEGLPTVLIEALAAGTPVIVTDSPGGSREIIEQTGTGQLISNNNQGELSEAIIKNLKEKQKRQADPNLSPFMLEYAADRYLDLLAQLDLRGDNL